MGKAPTKFVLNSQDTMGIDQDESDIEQRMEGALAQAAADLAVANDALQVEVERCARTMSTTDGSLMDANHPVRSLSDGTAIE